MVQPAADPRDVTGAVEGPEACEQYLTEPIAKHYAIKDRNVPDYRKDIHEKVFIIHLSKLLLQPLQPVGYGIFGNGKNDLHEDHLKIQSTSFEQKLS